jgi:hypothetical protein
LTYLSFFLLLKQCRDSRAFNLLPYYQGIAHRIPDEKEAGLSHF